MNKREFEAIAETRLKDAQILYQHKRYDGAYYLAGYVIECALKACIAKKTKRHDFPDKEHAQRSYTHDLQRLLELVGPSAQLDRELQNNPLLGAKWSVVSDWKETSRYRKPGQQEAKSMLDSVAGTQGVFECIKKYW